MTCLLAVAVLAFRQHAALDVPEALLDPQSAEPAEVEATTTADPEAEAKVVVRATPGEPMSPTSTESTILADSEKGTEGAQGEIARVTDWMQCASWRTVGVSMKGGMLASQQAGGVVSCQTLVNASNWPGTDNDPGEYSVTVNGDEVQALHITRAASPPRVVNVTCLARSSTCPATISSFPHCVDWVTVQIGSSDAPNKTIFAGDHIVGCNTHADKMSWAGVENGDEQFKISAANGSVTARRLQFDADGDEQCSRANRNATKFPCGWTMPLAVTCVSNKECDTFWTFDAQRVSTELLRSLGEPTFELTVPTHIPVENATFPYVASPTVQPNASLGFDASHILDAVGALKPDVHEFFPSWTAPNLRANGSALAEEFGTATARAPNGTLSGLVALEVLSDGSLRRSPGRDGYPDGPDAQMDMGIVGWASMPQADGAFDMRTLGAIGFLLVMYYCILGLGLMLTYKTACLQPDVKYFSSIVPGHSICRADSADTIAQTFNSKPDVRLHVRGAASFSLDLRSWVTEGTLLDTEPIEEFVRKKDPYAKLVLKQLVTFPEAEELVRRVRRQTGGAEVTIPLEQIIEVHRNCTDGNFYHNRTTRTLLALSFVGLGYWFYAWTRTKTYTATARFRLSLDLDRYWAHVGPRLHPGGFRP